MSNRLSSWYLDRDAPQRRVLLGLLAAAFFGALLLTLLPMTVAEQVVDTLLPSSRGGARRAALLERHRLVFGAMALGSVVASFMVPSIVSGFRRCVDYLGTLDTRIYVAAVVLAVVVTRILLSGHLMPIVPGEDSGHYWQLANTLLEEGRYIEYSPDSSGLHGFRAWRPPGFPAAVAATMLFVGRQQEAVLLLNALWAVVLSLSMYGVVRNLASEGEGKLAGVACLSYPRLFQAGFEVMTELQFAALLALTLYLIVRWGDEWKGLLGAGLVLGFAALTRGNGLLIWGFGLIALPLHFWWRRRDDSSRGISKLVPIGKTVPFLIGFLIVTGPWIVRNRAVTGHWVAIATSGGFNMWIGHHPGSSGIYLRSTRPGFPAGAGEVAMSRYGAERSLEYWSNAPLENLKTSARSIIEILKVDNGALGLIFHETESPSEQLIATLWILFNSVYYSLWFLAALWLLAKLLGRWPSDSRPGVLALTAIVYLATYVPFIGWSRYKVPVLPFLVALAVVTLYGLSLRDSSPVQSAERDFGNRAAA